jgi:hypothetical protein
MSFCLVISPEVELGCPQFFGKEAESTRDRFLVVSRCAGGCFRVDEIKLFDAGEPSHKLIPTDLSLMCCDL